MEKPKLEIIMRLLQFLPHNIIDNLKKNVKVEEYAKTIDYKILGLINNRLVAFVKNYTNMCGETVNISSDFTTTGQLFYITNNYYGNYIWLPFEGIEDNVIIKSSDKFITNKELLNETKNKEVYSFFRFINKNNFIVSMYLKTIILHKNTPINVIDSNDTLLNLIH
tara:strand:+ start:1671 stop:2168 length:498 start_codon:yes stop_codon:yes gene_type:complete